MLLSLGNIHNPGLSRQLFDGCSKYPEWCAASNNPWDSMDRIAKQGSARSSPFAVRHWSLSLSSHTHTHNPKANKMLNAALATDEQWQVPSRLRLRLDCGLHRVEHFGDGYSRIIIACGILRMELWGIRMYTVPTYGELPQGHTMPDTGGPGNVGAQTPGYLATPPPHGSSPCDWNSAWVSSAQTEMVRFQREIMIRTWKIMIRAY